MAKARRCLASTSMTCPTSSQGGEVLRWILGTDFGTPGCEQFGHGSHQHRTCLFGELISVVAPTTGQRVTLAPTSTFAASRIVHARLLAYSRRVYSPAEADLFYVPIYRE